MAIDLANGIPAEHGLRCTLIADRLGALLGLPEHDRADLYYVTLLRFLGCTADSHEVAQLMGDEIRLSSQFEQMDPGNPNDALAWALHHLGEGQPLPRRAWMFITMLSYGSKRADFVLGHCEAAQRLGARLGVSRRVVDLLDDVYERWDGKGEPRHRPGPDLAPVIRVIHLAKDVEIHHRYYGVDGAVAVARKRSGSALDPDLVELFCKHAEDVVEAVDVTSAWEAVLAAEPGPHRRMAPEHLAGAAEALADFADLKSAFLAGHSRRVARLSASALATLGTPQSQVATMRLAGLVHDLGRVAVSALVWDRSGPLTDAEWERVRLHPYNTERLLHRTVALRDAGGLAGLHHERLDGAGYHRGLGPAGLSLDARILAAADAYAALTEERAHRPARTADAAAKVLRADVHSGRLDRTACEAVLEAAGHRRQAREWPAALTDREVQVLRLMTCGLSLKQMAEALSVTVKTVDTHVQHIYDKIHVRSRAGAAVFAMEHELTGPDQDFS
jgi:HD-GYP domain-containing protein (c-di-GMP phosphodiesterase class II)